MKEKIIIGNKKYRQQRIKSNGKNPKKKYRVIIQERISEKNNVERMTSFMVYDFSGRTTIKSLSKRLQKFMDREK